ncbi:MAG: acyl-CoA dehydrogenase family protein [Candidatus Marinimicrobia bacterium]|nr:acyl-CoA dehydrogenase family protein [Candidatus Neomarinimicrobiota bacterium]
MNDKLGKIYFTQEHTLLREMVRDFARNEVAPVAEQQDRESKFPAALVKQMAELGLMGVPIPTEYGGAGMDTVAFAIAVHELAVADASTAITMGAHTSLGSMPILMFGTDEQKKNYLPKLASGEMLGAFGLTEPGAGSDAGATATRAVKHKDKYVINGQKIFCTNAGQAGLITFTARIFEGDEDKGICVFMAEADTQGIRLGPPEKKMGWRASDTRSVYFEDMELSAGQILGDPGKGFRQFLSVLTGGRISIAALSLGTAEGAYQMALKYANEREAFGQKIGKLQGIAFKLADLATGLQAAHHLVYHAAWLKDQGEDVLREAAMAKLYASELAMRTTTEAIQIHGGYGYIREYHVERFFRDAKVLEIGEGTSEIQRIVISRHLLEEAQAT